MSDIIVWNNVSVAAQTALATAKTISAITKANPGVATSTAHGLSDGDIVLLRVNGMRELDYVVARVANKTDDTFELEGIDTTLFGTFVSGTAAVITFGAEASTFQDVSHSGGEVEPITVRTIHTDYDIEIPGNTSAEVYSFTSLWLPDDPCLLALRAAGRAKAVLATRLVFAGGETIYFAARPTASLAATGSAGAAVTTPVAFRLAAPITTYAS